MAFADRVNQWYVGSVAWFAALAASEQGVRSLGNHSIIGVGVSGEHPDDAELQPRESSLYLDYRAAFATTDPADLVGVPVYKMISFDPPTQHKTARHTFP